MGILYCDGTRLAVMGEAVGSDGTGGTSSENECFESRVPETGISYFGSSWWELGVYSKTVPVSLFETSRLRNILFSADPHPQLNLRL